jgi:hypothetical protein
MDKKRRYLVIMWGIAPLALIAYIKFITNIHPSMPLEFQLIMLFVVFIAIILVLFLNKSQITKNIFLHLSLILILFIWVLSNSPIGLNFTYIKSSAGNEWLDSLDREFHLSEQDTLLYLDSGIFPYYYRTKSSCRYFYPLPIQRANTNPYLYETKPYAETYNCIMNYSGEFVILSPSWFGITQDDKKDLKDKLYTNYSVVYSNPSKDIQILRENS